MAPVVVMVTVVVEGSVVEDDDSGVGEAAVVMVTVKTPPVAGMRATSPMEVEKVERSSWANCGLEVRGSLWRQVSGMVKGTYVGGSEHPLALRAKLDRDAGEG